jgi:hypothetical protein
VGIFDIVSQEEGCARTRRVQENPFLQRERADVSRCSQRGKAPAHWASGASDPGVQGRVIERMFVLFRTRSLAKGRKMP